MTEDNHVGIALGDPKAKGTAASVASKTTKEDKMTDDGQEDDLADADEVTVIRKKGKREKKASKDDPDFDLLKACGDLLQLMKETPSVFGKDVGQFERPIL